MKNLLKLLLLTWMLGYGLHAYGQEVYISKLQPIHTKSNVSLQSESKIANFKIIGKINGRIYIARVTKTDYFIDVYNENMEHEAIVALDFLPKKAELIDFALYENTMAVFYIEKVKGEEVLYSALLDTAGMLTIRPKKLSEEKQSFLKGSTANIEVLHSLDKSQLAVLIYKSNHTEFEVIQLNDQLDKIHQFDFKLDNKNKLQNREAAAHISITNKGVIIFPTYNLRNAYVNEISLLFIDVPNRQSHVTSLLDDNIYLNDFELYMDERSNILHLAGTYKKSRGGNVAGVYKSNLFLSSGPPVAHNMEYKFPEKFLETVQQKKSQQAMNNHKVKDLIIRQDGGFLLVTESQQVISRVRNTSFTSNYSTTEYYFGDVVVSNYNQDGVLLWSELVRKSQASIESDALLSFGMLNTGASLVMMYYDKNTNDEINVAAIDNAGKLQSTRIPYDGDLHWLMQDAEQLDKRSILVPLRNRNEYGFAKVTF